MAFESERGLIGGLFPDGRPSGDGHSWRQGRSFVTGVTKWNASACRPYQTKGQSEFPIFVALEGQSTLLPVDADSNPSGKGGFRAAFLLSGNRCADPVKEPMMGCGATVDLRKQPAAAQCWQSIFDDAHFLSSPDIDVDVQPVIEFECDVGRIDEVSFRSRPPMETGNPHLVVA